MKRLTKYFLNGLIFIVPSALTIYIVYLLFVTIDSLLKIPIPGVGIIPGVGFVTTLILITLTGLLVSNFLTRKLLFWFDDVMERLPLIKLIYSSVKDLVNAFLGDKKTLNRPVMVKLSKDTEAHALGFITCDSLKNFGLEEYIAVYLPQSYNFAGNLLVFPREQVTPLAANSSDLMTFIVSGGVAAGESGGEGLDLALHS